MVDLADRLLRAHESDAPYPSLRAEEPDAGIARAYEVQRAFAGLLHGHEIGYKAALTAHPAQQAMGIDEPVLGVLFDWCETPDGARLTPQRAVVIETEIGYRLGTDVTEPVSAEDVPNLIKTCHAMLEIASPNLSGDRNGIDLIASNSATFRLVQGETISREVDGVAVRLVRDAEVLHEAGSGSVMGGQANALAWLINKALSLGYPVKQDMLLMSGSIGQVQPGKPGVYRGEFDDCAGSKTTLSVTLVSS